MIKLTDKNPAIWIDGKLLNAATCNRDKNGRPISYREEHQLRLEVTRVEN